MDELACRCGSSSAGEMEVDTAWDTDLADDGLGLDAPAGGVAGDLLRPTTFELSDVDIRSQRGDAARCEVGAWVGDALPQVMSAAQRMLNTPCAQHLTPCYSHACILPDVCATGLS